MLLASILKPLALYRQECQLRYNEINEHDYLYELRRND